MLGRLLIAPAEVYRLAAA